MKPTYENSINLTSQQRAEQVRMSKRKGTPTFSAVRFTDTYYSTAAEKKLKIDKVIKRLGYTREAALIKAFDLLIESLIDTTNNP